MTRAASGAARLLAAMALLAMPAAAAEYDFSGVFGADDDVVLLDFMVGGAGSLVTVFSSSWRYGDPPLGAGPGGFDPMLGIWRASGELVYFQDDGARSGSTSSNGVYYDHGSWDSWYQVWLEPGSYIASVTQYGNFPNGFRDWFMNGETAWLGAGFGQAGNPDFTFDAGYGGASQAMFNGVWDGFDPRTGQWEFHVLNVAEAARVVPEPGTFALLASGLAGLAGLGRVRAKRRSRRG